MWKGGENPVLRKVVAALARDEILAKIVRGRLQLVFSFQMLSLIVVACKLDR